MQSRAMAGIVAVIAVGVLTAGAAQGAIFNVNIITAGNPEAGLVGPAGGLGETWNQFDGTSASGLLDSTGAASTVGFTTTNLSGPWNWANPSLKMIHAGRARFSTTSTTPQGLTINGLTNGDSYDVWIASANTLGSQRSQGEWTMVNPTTSAPVQTVDNTANIIGDTWVEGNNYVVYRNVEVDAGGEIALTGLARRDNPYDTRLPLNGFQLTPAVPDGALVGQLGILDLGANGGINPATGSPWQVGDPYRFAFVTSGVRDAQSTNIDDYNTFVQNAAIASSLDLSGATWKVIASSEAVNARVNTGTTGTVGEAIFLLDGSTIVANDYGDMWNGNLDNPINLDENANLREVRVFAGTTAGGSTVANRWLGTTTISNNQLRVETGESFDAGGHWMQQYNSPPTATHAFYALSDPLGIIVSGDPVRYEVAGDNNIGTEIWTGEQQDDVIGPVTGAKFVRVVQNVNNTFQVAELQAFDMNGVNQAEQSQGGVATAANYGWGGTPDRANDGNTNMAWSGGSLWHSANADTWLQVELDQATDLNSVHFWGRTDCCQDRQGDFNLIIENAFGTELTNEQIVGLGSTAPYHGDIPVTGLVSANLMAILNSHDFGAGYTYVFELGSADMIAVDNPDPSIFDTYLDLNNAALEVELLDPNMTFAVGDVFDLFDADVIQGMYHSLILPDIGPGLALYGGYLPIDGRLIVMVPEPATLSLLGLGAMLASRRRRKR